MVCVGVSVKSMLFRLFRCVVLLIIFLVLGSSILLWSVVMFNGVLRITAGSFCFTSVNVLLNASVSPEMAGKVNGIAFSLGGKKHFSRTNALY